MERGSLTPSSWCDSIEDRQGAKPQRGQVSEGSKDADKKGRGKVTHARGDCRMVNVVSVLMLISM